MVQVDYKKTDQTILTIVVGLVVIHWLSGNEYLLHAAILIGLLSLISRKIGNGINWLWMKLAWVLSLIVPKILLAAIFYLFLFPIAVLASIFWQKRPFKN